MSRSSGDDDAGDHSGQDSHEEDGKCGRRGRGEVAQVQAVVAQVVEADQADARVDHHRAEDRLREGLEEPTGRSPSRG